MTLVYFILALFVLQAIYTIWDNWGDGA